IRERNPVIHGDWRVRPAAGQGSAPRRRSSERRASPVRFASPMRRRSSATGEAAADATGQRWLLEPSDSCFASPQPAGSFTELSAGCYQYKASPEQLYLDLDRCNRALRVLLEQNSALKSQLKAALAAQEEANCKQTPSTLEREEMLRNKIKRSLSRMADQEMAVAAYCDVLREVGRALGLWEKMVMQLRRETMREQEETLFLEDQLGYEVATFEIERKLLLADLDMQNKADARIAELSLVIATSHLDVERLQQENDILRNQLVIERQSRKDI
ncbi:Protein of unknown function, partial [Gryllus bimaculatus]